VAGPVPEPFSQNICHAKAGEGNLNLNVEIPDDLASRLNAVGGDLSRRALEALGLEEYKGGRITKAELRRLLGFDTRCEFDGFLKAHDVWINFSIEDLHREVATLQRLGF
jgi:hypothetical protein